MKKSIIAFLFLSVSVFAQEEAKFRKIDSLFNYLCQNDRFMGSVQIRENNTIVFDKAYGFADYKAKIKANPTTKYKIGSITKTFTAALIFQLIEEKKLNLATKLSKFYPEIKNADKITLSQMLNHKSGIFNFTAEDNFEKAVLQPITKDAMIAKIAWFTPAFEPNVKAEYSNSNYILLGYIIEKITNKSYFENVNKRIISKIDLKNTSYYNQIDSSENEAFSYQINADKKIEKFEEWNESNVGAAGGLQSTSGDLNLFTQALFEGKIINKTSLSEMTKLDAGFGKGIFSAPFGDRIFYTHNGGIEGFISTYGYYPKDKLGFSILMNLDNYNMNELVIDMLSIYYKMPFEFPKFQTLAVDQAVLKNYEGIYGADNFPLKLTIKLQNGALTGQATGQPSFPLIAVSETEFLFEQAKISIEFVKDGFNFVQNGRPMTFKRE